MKNRKLLIFLEELYVPIMKRKIYLSALDPEKLTARQLQDLRGYSQTLMAVFACFFTVLVIARLPVFVVAALIGGYSWHLNRGYYHSLLQGLSPDLLARIEGPRSFVFRDKEKMSVDVSSAPQAPGGPWVVYMIDADGSTKRLKRFEREEEAQKHTAYLQKQEKDGLRHFGTEYYLERPDAGTTSVERI